MDLFISGYDIFKDGKSKKRAMQIEAIAYKRAKAVESRIKRDMIAIETGSYSKMLESLPEDERKRALEDARQSAKDQQERLATAQHEQWEKERNIKHGYIQNK